MQSAQQTGEPKRWAILLGCALASMVSAAPVIATTVSLFIVPVSTEFGWDRSQFPLAIMAAAWVGGLAAPIAGRVIDRFGARRVMLVGIVAFALANAAISLADGSRLRTYVLYMILGASSSFSGYVGITKIISAWFEESRGRALGISLGLGIGLGSALTPFLVQFIIQNHGWRAAYQALGVTVFVIGFPAIFFLAPSRAPVRSISHSHVPGHEAGLTAAEATRTREFWLLLLLIVFNGFVAGSISGHWVPVHIERGVSVTLATLLLSAFGMIKIAGQVGGGVLLDRIQTPRTALLILTPLTVAAATFALGAGAQPMIIAALLFGLGEGAELGLVPYLASRYFGLKRFGEIAGWLTAASIISAGLGNLTMGRLFDATGGYQMGLYCAAGCAIAVFLAASALGPYRFVSPRGPRRSLADQAAPSMSPVEP